MTTVVQVEVTAPRQDSTVFHVVLDDDQSATSAAGAAADPDFTMVLTPAEFTAVVARELRIDEGYMQGRVKVTGNVGRMLSVLPLLLTEAWTETMAAAGPTA